MLALTNSSISCTAKVKSIQLDFTGCVEFTTSVPLVSPLTVEASASQSTVACRRLVGETTF